MDRIQDCTECEYMREYDYGKRMYYCDNEARTDDMGKLGAGYPPEASPGWCPLRGEI